MVEEVDVTEHDAKDRLKWRQVIFCGEPYRENLTKEEEWSSALGHVWINVFYICCGSHLPKIQHIGAGFTSVEWSLNECQCWHYEGIVVNTVGRKIQV